MIFQNPNTTRQPYPPALQALLNQDACRAGREALSQWPLLAPQPTPLWPQPGLAAALGLAGVDIKDESKRSALASFKALGAPLALLWQVQRRWPHAGWSAAALFAGRHAQALAGYTVVSATDGNHGRALAAAAQSLGCRCVIVLHAQVSAERETAIAACGAEIVRIAGNYDASVAEAARLAEANGWDVISDTSYEGYEAVPRDVMQGYAVIADEALELAPDGPCPYSHVVLQGGVGGLAAGIVSLFWQRYGAARPRFIVVEPEQADCLLQSARAGRPVPAGGSVDSVMAGLACGEPSPLAWRFLQPAVDLFMTVGDEAAVAAMRRLAEGAHGDVPVLAGESGVAGLAGLLALCTHPDGRAAAGLDAGSRVLLINTEGATAPALYRELVSRDASAVLAAQRGWLARQAIAEDRLLARLNEHGAIGATADGGVCRLALSDADRAGRDRLVAWMRELGLAVQIDAIGNIFGTRAGTEPGAAPVMVGSHIDTVANGGRYDGNYGVLAGLEVLRRLDEDGVHTRRPIVVAAFTNEEGVRYQPDMLGSLVHAGGLALQDALDTVGSDGTRLGDELRRIGYAGELPVGSIRPHAYVELHIEQGPVLEAEGAAIGAVADLQGISWQEIVIRGQSNHAGTTPMRLRHDAGQAAAAVAVFVRELALRLGAGQVATVGRLELQPGLINVIASQATLTVDLRNSDEDRLRQAEAELQAFLQRLAEQEGVTITARRLARFEPVVFDPRLLRLIEAAAAARGLATRRMTSGAGHDAQMLARICPAAMIFVPSAGGLSHNPREHTSAAELAQGASVLLDVVRRLAAE
ncbi:diaminopropionate ammonia-lyase [Rubrivivax gelatinosus]|nr:diaminopropionate ammonia-lyase [Rubrivivax gelatinosus]